MITFQHIQKRLIASFLGLIGLLLLTELSEAQRRVIDYESLRVRSGAPNVFFDYNSFTPAPGSEKATVMGSFTIEFNYLRFRRVRDDDQAPDGQQFITDVEISTEFFKLDGPPVRVQSSSRRRAAEPEERNRGTRIGNVIWRDFVFASTYEQTQSGTQFVEGSFLKDLEPGHYRLISVLRTDGRTRGSITRFIYVPDYTNLQRARMFFLDGTGFRDDDNDFPLVNLGSNVYFGKDFTALVVLPEKARDSDVSVRVRRATITERDTTFQSSVFEKSISATSILHGSIRPVANKEVAKITRLPSENPQAYLLVEIPNTSFPNSRYVIQIFKKEDGSETLLGQKFFENRWFDMPVSLLNIDVAISMLRFIISDQELARMRRGSAAEKEERFRKFWAERNPTPDTEFNELMVEYYRRIDFAFENFTTPTSPGYLTDQGRVYITQGPPKSIDRRFPGNQATIEVWDYGNRKFIFRATTGFGDYELIERR